MIQWSAFICLGLLWGSSFVWLRLAQNEISPFTLITARIFVGCLTLAAIIFFKKISLRGTFKNLPAFIFTGLFNTAVPFALLTWGVGKIPIGLASILNATVPLMTVGVAHVMLQDEKATLLKITGVSIGFLGIIILMGAKSSNGLPVSILGQLAVLAAAICYATATTYSRKHLIGVPSIVQSFMTVTTALVASTIFLFFVEGVPPLPRQPVTWIAIFWLGILGTAISYLLFYYLVNAWGSSRTSLVTYLFPVVGVTLGSLIFKEEFGLRQIIGGLLVFAGILVVNNLQSFKNTQSRNQTAS